MKMVDITQPFHLTLINVAFAKLEQKSSVDISNFFSPQKDTESWHGKPIDKVEPTPECKLLQQSTDFQNNNEVTTNSKVFKTDDKSRSMMQKWLCKTTSISGDFKGSDNHNGDIRECKEPVASLSFKAKESKSIKPLKRPSSTSNTTQEQHKTKRKREQLDTSSNVVHLLPPDLDVSVFLELPSHIQKDILAEAASYSQNRITMTDGRGDNGFILSNTSATAASTISNQVSLPLQFTRGTVVETASTSESGVAHKQPDIGHHISNKFKSQLEQQKLRNDKPASPSEPNLLETTDSDTQLESSNSESLSVPDGIDKAVFAALPDDIKEDLITQWKHKVWEPKQQHVGKIKKTLLDKPFFKMPKPSSSTNITSYFSKKT